MAEWFYFDWLLMQQSERRSPLVARTHEHDSEWHRARLVGHPVHRASMRTVSDDTSAAAAAPSQADSALCVHEG